MPHNAPSAWRCVHKKRTDDLGEVYQKWTNTVGNFLLRVEQRSSVNTTLTTRYISLLCVRFCGAESALLIRWSCVRILQGPPLLQRAAQRPSHSHSDRVGQSIARIRVAPTADALSELNGNPQGQQPQNHSGAVTGAAGISP